MGLSVDYDRVVILHMHCICLHLYCIIRKLSFSLNCNLALAGYQTGLSLVKLLNGFRRNSGLGNDTLYMFSKSNWQLIGSLQDLKTLSSHVFVYIEMAIFQLLLLLGRGVCWSFVDKTSVMQDPNLKGVQNVQMSLLLLSLMDPQ